MRASKQPRYVLSPDGHSGIGLSCEFDLIENSRYNYRELIQRLLYMKCPFCNKEYETQEEVMNCVAEHVRASQEEAVKNMQKQSLMLMASQLTMAALATQASARDVVERFGEIYELLESLTEKPDVVTEIEKWLKEKDDSGNGI
jgi:hypothetical protein